MGVHPGVGHPRARAGDAHHAGIRQGGGPAPRFLPANGNAGPTLWVDDRVVENGPGGRMGRWRSCMRCSIGRIAFWHRGGDRRSAARAAGRVRRRLTLPTRAHAPRPGRAVRRRVGRAPLRRWREGEGGLGWRGGPNPPPYATPRAQRLGDRACRRALGDATGNAERPVRPLRSGPGPGRAAHPRIPRRLPAQRPAEVGSSLCGRDRAATRPAAPVARGVPAARHAESPSFSRTASTPEHAHPM
jgi:hypothetical protein